MSQTGTDRKFANTLERGLRILEAFTIHDVGLTHAQISERTGLPKPTVSRLTYTLSKLEYLSQNGRNGRFFPGPAALVLGTVATFSVPFLEIVAGDMQRLADKTGTLTAVSVRYRDLMVLLCAWHPATGQKVGAQSGHRIPLLGSSSGQAVLGALDDARFERLKPGTALRAIRKNGYAQLMRDGFTIVPREMRYPGRVNAVGVPYFAPALGQPVGFSCGGPTGSLTDQRLREEVAPALRATVHSLEQRTDQASAISIRAQITREGGAP